MKLFAALFCALAFVLPATASPGAHGPNGEHLDAPGGNAAAPSSVPRVETFSELFELVGHLSGGELSVLIDRYETNEPVLNGQLEVEYQGRKARAKFHADLGDYSIDDPAFLKALSTPGKHPLLFTFVAGEDSDLLEGTLEVGTAQEAHDHEHGASRGWLVAAIALAVVLAALAALFARRRRQPRLENQDEA